MADSKHFRIEAWSAALTDINRNWRLTRPVSSGSLLPGPTPKHDDRPEFPREQVYVEPVL